MPATPSEAASPVPRRSQCLRVNIDDPPFMGDLSFSLKNQTGGKDQA
jgi:hypothetical protein